MRATVDAKRHRRLERLLARLRVRCFENEESARLIPIIKARLEKLSAMTQIGGAA